MKKNIVLFSDGTGNSAGKFNKTNVWRLYKALDLSETKPDKLQQIAYYDDGVGTSSFKLMALLGGAFGIGLKRNVIDLYTFLCRHYQDQDNIYGFGFSRGAFTIRVLIGLIDNQGLIDSQKAKTETELRRLATRAFRAYRGARYREKSLGMKLSRFLRDNVVSAWNRLVGNQPYEKSKNREVPAITFVGLWDTVDAYGMPIDELKDAWDWIFPLTLPDQYPSAKINRICHALALDDERHTFHPVLLNESRLDSKQEVKQVWFAGVHSNVGGGYPDDAMAMISLDWMINEIEKEPCTTRIVFKEGEREKIRAAADVGGKLYDSRRGLAGVYRYQLRKIETLIRDKDNQFYFKRAKIHETVFERIKQNADGYAPIVLPNNYEVVRTQRDVIDESCIAAKESVFEHPTQAQYRAYVQEKVWNQV